MCTVSYVKQGPEVIITANRDESPHRNAVDIEEYETLRGEVFLIPREPVHGGSNLAVGKQGRTLTLLNGAFEPHPIGRSYRMSRGLVLLAALEYSLLQDFANSFDFEGIEPFTLLHFSESIEEMRWDGKSLIMINPNGESPHIWASAQLYAPEFMAARRRWFAQVLESGASADSLWHLHRYGGEGDPANDMVMERFGMVQTVSISQILRGRENSMIHMDLLSGTHRRMLL